MSEEGVVLIGGEEYVIVAKRVADFRDQYPVHSGYCIMTELIHADEALVRMKATVRDPHGRILGSGHAEEYRESSFINKTSALENAETGAVGRALAACGYGGRQYASAEEVVGALSQRPAGEAISEGHFHAVCDLLDQADQHPHAFVEAWREMNEGEKLAFGGRLNERYPGAVSKTKEKMREILRADRDAKHGPLEVKEAPVTGKATVEITPEAREQAKKVAKQRRQRSDE